MTAGPDTGTTINHVFPSSLPPNGCRMNKRKQIVLVMLAMGWALCLPRVFGQQNDYQFARYGTERGLSHNYVNCFLKDRQGFLWIGTADGLNRFDGYSFKTFKHDPTDSATIDDHHIIGLFEDPAGYIWISTHKGYTVYDPATERISRDANRAATRLGLPDADFSRVIRTANGNYWIAHNRLGLVYFKTSENELVTANYNPPRDQGRPDAPVIADFNEDRSGQLWIVYTNGRLVRIDGNTHQVTYQSDALRDRTTTPSVSYRVYVDEDGEPWVYIAKALLGVFYFDTQRHQILACNTSSAVFRLTNTIVSAIDTGPDGRIWVGTDHGGINVIDKRTRTVSVIRHNPDDPRSLSQNSVMSLYRDPSGMIWVGTFKKGFCNYHENIFKFSTIRHSPSVPASLPFDDINVFVEDKAGNIWIGSNGGGLIYFDRVRNSFRQFRNVPGDPHSLSNDVIVSLFIDSEDVLWIGTYFGGLNRFDGQNFKRYTHNPGDPGSLMEDRVWEIYEDSQKRLWIGTLGSGLDLFDRKNEKFTHFRPLEANSIQSGFISTILEDQVGNLWIGTADGVNVLMRQTGKFVYYKHDANRQNSLSNNRITAMLEDSKGDIWIGTTNGLNLFDKKTNSFRRFDTRDGLPDNGILTILADSNGGLWMGTAKGLVNLKFKKRTENAPAQFTVHTYNEVDGLQGRSFNENAALSLSSGELIFGGASGFSIFEPGRLPDDSGASKVVLTDFQIFNRSVKPGEQHDGRVVLPRSISQTEQVELQHSQNVFTIEFAALNFLHADKNHYQYTLEGFNDQWFEADNNTRKVTYTNLDPGDYVFRVRMGDARGESGERKLQIRILPPFWSTPLAYLLYFLVIVAALMVARWILLERERMNFRLVQERREAQQLHELDLMKIKFFTNVSHEFRTPLTLMLTPLEGLLKSMQHLPEVRSQLAMIHRNATRLFNLVSQLLDFKKMEVEDTAYQPEKGDIVQFLREIAYTFSDLSERRHIAFAFQSEKDSILTRFDPEKLSRIMYNLLSNAFKFTPEHGQVSVSLHVLDGTNGYDLQIRVKDSGIGIPEADLPKVFDRFFQHRLPSHIVNQGSGIGLSITKEFVKLHDGTIRAESQVGAGSTFIVTLPITYPEGIEAIEPALAEPLPDQHTTPTKPVLLLVEDNDDFREYMKQTLSAEYRVYDAPNGKIGLSLTLDLVPDLIVSDLMMPEMDGIELCRLIKTDSRLSHIPLVLLTARAEDEQKLQGYETGADAYVTKPFRMDILLARIKNLIVRREMVQKRFQQHIEIAPSEVEIRPVDEQFIAKAIKTVEDHLANPDYTVEELSSELAMSRMYLYKKLLSLTGKTPVEFIRIIRMRRAAFLLEKSQLTIAEIAYEVGFNNPKYFTRLFKEEFKVLPTEYRKREAANH